MIEHKSVLDKKHILVKQAVSLAMKGSWDLAVEANQRILKSVPEDIETLNRLGKAFSELGRIPEAKKVFEHVLLLAPHNSIARKNIRRLANTETASRMATNERQPLSFLEESGKTISTSLHSLNSNEFLLKTTPGHTLAIEPSGATVKIMDNDGSHVGQLDGKLASRLARLIAGGNRYDIVVTGVGDNTISVFIREVFRHPGQAHSVSFPSNQNHPTRKPQPIKTSQSQADYDPQSELSRIKDWTDDDTEPGDDQDFNPAIHRVVDSSDQLDEDL
jgi:hypothetical protein